MSRELLESIINKDYVSANELFEQKLNDIRERKLYEEKRRMAAKLDEIFGGMTKKDIEDRRERGYKRASEVLDDPTKKLKPLVKLKPAKEKKKVSEEAIDEAGLAPTDVGKLYRKGLKAGGRAATALSNLRKGYRKQQASVANPPEDEHKRLRQTFGVERPDDKKRPGRLQRNINTLMGREAGYVKPEKTDAEKEMNRGGRAGKALRATGKGIGKAYGVWGNVLSKGMSGNLE